MSTSKSFLSQEHRHRSVNPSHRLLLCSPRSRLARGEGCCNRGERCWRLPLRFNSPTPGAVSAPGFPPDLNSAPGSVTPAAGRQVTFVPSTEPTASPPTQRSRGQGLGTSRPRAGAAPRVRDTPAATPTGGAVTGAPALRVPQPTSARPRAHHLSGRRARTRARAPGQQAPRPAPKESLARAARKPRQMEALPEGGPYAGGVGAFDLLQDPLVLRDRAQSLAALRHLGWKRRRRPGGRARRRADRRSERQVAQARRGSAGRGLRGGAGPVWVGRRGWGPPLGRARPWGGSADCGGGGDRARGSVFPRAPPLVM